jgi:hypothetical protein
LLHEEIVIAPPGARSALVSRVRAVIMWDPITRGALEEEAD